VAPPPRVTPNHEEGLWVYRVVQSVDLRTKADWGEEYRSAQSLEQDSLVSVGVRMPGGGGVRCVKLTDGRGWAFEEQFAGRTRKRALEEVPVEQGLFVLQIQAPRGLPLRTMPDLAHGQEREEVRNFAIHRVVSSSFRCRGNSGEWFYWMAYRGGWLFDSRESLVTMRRLHVEPARHLFRVHNRGTALAARRYPDYDPTYKLPDSRYEDGTTFRSTGEVVGQFADRFVKLEKEGWLFVTRGKEVVLEDLGALPGTNSGDSESESVVRASSPRVAAAPAHTASGSASGASLETTSAEDDAIANYLEGQLAEVNQRRRLRAAAEMPDEFVCPLTHDLMVEPVVCADGFTYERDAIKTWLRQSDRSPMTNLPLEHKGLLENRALRGMIRAAREKTGIEE
jgi:U-box domain